MIRVLGKIRDYITGLIKDPSFSLGKLIYQYGEFILWYLKTTQCSFTMKRDWLRTLTATVRGSPHPRIN